MPESRYGDLFSLSANRAYDQRMGTERDEAEDWVTKELIDFLVDVEGAHESFKKTGIHHVYGDPAKERNPTIGYGHKLKEGEEFPGGISDEKARILLREDTVAHMRSLRDSFDRKYGRGTFAKLPMNRKHALLDYEFNIGNAVTNYKKFTQAVVDWDVDQMRAEHTRHRTATREEIKSKDPKVVMKTKRVGGKLTKVPMVGMERRDRRMWNACVEPHIGEKIAGI